MDKGLSRSAILVRELASIFFYSVSELEQIDDFSIPRPHWTCSGHGYQLHAFRDASKEALAAAVYLRPEDSTRSPAFVMPRCVSPLARPYRCLVSVAPPRSFDWGDGFWLVKPTYPQILISPRISVNLF